MKKLVSVFLAVMLLYSGAALAQDMGVQVIGGNDVQTETVSWEDAKVGLEYEVPGSCVITLAAYNVVDGLGILNRGHSNSGNEADYALLRVDILNTSMKEVNFLTDVSVTVYYDEDYSFSGWAHQYDYDISEKSVIEEEKWFAINPMYQGHYALGCTLPNAVLSGKKPLRMVFSIDGNEITYNIRK